MPNYDRWNAAEARTNEWKTGLKDNINQNRFEKIVIERYTSRQILNHNK